MKLRSKYCRASMCTEQHTKKGTILTPRGNFSNPSMKLTGGLELGIVLTLGHPYGNRPFESPRDNFANNGLYSRWKTAQHKHNCDELLFRLIDTSDEVGLFPFLTDARSDMIHDKSNH